MHPSPRPRPLSKRHSTGWRRAPARCWPMPSASRCTRACRPKPRSICKRWAAEHERHARRHRSRCDCAGTGRGQARLALADLLDRQRRRLPGLAGHDHAVRRLRCGAGGLSRQLGRRHVLGAERLHGGLCGHADTGGRPVRCAWAQEGLPDRRHALPGGLGRLRPVRQRGLADRSAGAAGGGCGAADAGFAVHRAGGFSAEQAGGGGEPLGRGRRFRRGGGAEPGFLCRRCDRLALGLLPEPAAGRLVDLARRGPAAGSQAARQPPPHRRAGHAAADRGRGRHRPGHRAVRVAAVDPHGALGHRRPGR
eukprot:Opistho-1_new@36480